MEPGVELGRLLAGLEPLALTSHDQVTVVAACRRMVSHYQALSYRAIWTLVSTELARDEDEAMKQGVSPQPQDAFFLVTTELGAALHLSTRAAQNEVNRALGLERVPSVFEALLRGRIDLYRAGVLIDRTCHLPDPDLSWVLSQMIEEAESLTASQIRVRVDRLCYLADPEEAKLRYGEAVRNRYVEVRGSEFGTATLEGRDLPPDRAEAAYKHLKRLARKLKQKGDPRTIDQLMADLFLAQLLGEEENQGKTTGGAVELRVDLETLAGLTEAPGELSGLGPVISDIARQVAEEQRHCTWSWTVTDPETGMPVHTGVTRRRPSRETRRWVEARNPSCIFPGCRRPARECDLDHRLSWAERGPTCECNLVPLCRRHHRCRHRLGWRHQPLPRGDHLWISPLGHRYTTSGRPP
ncbi:MAG TPA: DUF222 domain-containing protein [Acidimicrobiia bacterium]|nr:DUF222 domain-containing protein [Acidimicrobiia bacterium]